MANEMLTGLLGQKKGSQTTGTTTNPYGGAVPSPVAQPQQTVGFQNRTNNPQWWKGGAAPATTGAPAPMGATSGYGSSTPTPAPPPAGTPPAGTPATPAVKGEPSGETPPAEPKYSPVQQNQINFLEKQIMQYQLQSAQYPAGSDYGDKIRMYLQQAMMKLQWAKQGKLSSV